MPFKSDAQRGAMYAAAAGKSNIGIPKSVGQRYVADSVKHSTGTKSRLKDEMKKRYMERKK